mgnify:CR=1 FL=1
MDELKSNVKELNKRLELFEDECYDKDIDLDDLKSYQELKDVINDCVLNVPSFMDKLQKIIDQLSFI